MSGAKPSSRFSVLTVGAYLTAACASHATIAFDNFGPGNAFNHSTGYTETGSPPGQSVGEGFTAAFGGALSTITIAMSHTSGPNEVHLYLSDGSTGTPGTVLESWVLSNLPQNGTAYSPVVIHSLSQPILAVGNLYYLYSQEPGSEVDAWNLNSISEQGNFIVNQNGSPYSSGTHTQGAFRVEVTPVPEPAAATLRVAFGVIALRRGRP